MLIFIHDLLVIIKDKRHVIHKMDNQLLVKELPLMYKLESIKKDTKNIYFWYSPLCIEVINRSLTFFSLMP